MARASRLEVWEPQGVHRWVTVLTVFAATTASAETLHSSIRGTILQKSDKTAVAGATIVASKTGGGGEEVAISDEAGGFTLTVERGSYDITVYYADGTTEAAKALAVDGDLVFAPIIVEDASYSSGCVFWEYPPPELTSYPRLGFSAQRSFHPVSRDRTHRAWIAPAASADPATAVTTLDGGTRLARGPGVPLAFVSEVYTSTTRVTIETPAGLGGATGVALRSGANDPAGDATLVFGLDGREPSEGAELFLGGPLVKDKLWLAGGLVASRDTDDTLAADSLLHATYMPTPDHTISLVGLAHAKDSDDRASWAAAKWTGRFFDYKLRINTIATAEAFTRPFELAARTVSPSADGELIDRYGAQTSSDLHFKAAGHHTLAAGLGGGAGRRGDLAHADASGFVGDDWYINPSITLDVGGRWEARRFDHDHVAAVLPRASITWDPTREGRGDVFVAYQRMSRLDDGLPGDWRTLEASGELFADELASGFAISEHDVMVGIAGKARWLGDDRKLGLQSWARIERARTTISAQLDSLDKVGTLLARYKWLDRRQTKLATVASLRATPDRADAGVAMTLHRRLHDDHHDDLAVDLTLEGHGGPDGPGSRLLLGMSW